MAKNLADRVAKGLMSKYGCVLGDGQINKRHELGVDDPVANLLNRYFTVSTPKRVIDDSPGEDEGELDHVGRDAAVEYLLMPERVKKMEVQVENVLTDLAKISGSLEKLEKMGYSLAKVAEALGKLQIFKLIKRFQAVLEAKNTLRSQVLRQEISALRGKTCKHIIKAASLNDTWSMRRYSVINSYLAELNGSGV